MKEEFTIVIQGRIRKECLAENIKNSMGLPVIVSTWEGQDLLGCGEPSLVVKSKVPENPGIQNFMLQLVSTIKGLDFVETKYAIKVRGDEYYKYDDVVNSVLREDSKIHTAPVFFRPFGNPHTMEYGIMARRPYAISDHMMAGKTDLLKRMFVECKNKYEKTMNYEDSKEWGLTKAHMRNMGFEDFQNFSEGKNAMKSMFGVILMKSLEPYFVTCNCCKKVFKNNFRPEEWSSIEDMDQL